MSTFNLIFPQGRRTRQVASAEWMRGQGPITWTRKSAAPRRSFTNFTTGKSHSFRGNYYELTSDERIRYTDKFDDPNLPGEMQTTIALEQVFCGTKLNVTREGVPGAIPAEACYVGWQASLTLLAKLVETEIPDQP